MMNAKQYLTFLMRSMAPSQAEVASMERQRKQWGRLRAAQTGESELEAAYESLSGPLSELQTEFLSSQLWPYLLAALASDKREAASRTPLAVLPLRTVNACAATAPNGEPFLIIDGGLLSMTHFHLETQIVVAAIAKARGFDQAVEHHGRALRFILQYYEGEGEMSFPLPDPSLQIPVESLYLATVQALAVETFVLAHEIAHVVAGHLESATTKAAVPVAGTELSLDVLHQSWEQEFEADALGLLLYQAACGSIPALQGIREPARSVTPLLFFSLVALVETNLHREDGLSTHPPARDRLSNLLSVIEARMDGETLQLAKGIAELASTVPTLARR